VRLPATWKASRWIRDEVARYFRPKDGHDGIRAGLCRARRPIVIHRSRIPDYRSAVALTLRGPRCASARRSMPGPNGNAETAEASALIPQISVEPGCAYATEGVICRGDRWAQRAGEGVRHDLDLRRTSSSTAAGGELPRGRRRARDRNRVVLDVDAYGMAAGGLGFASVTDELVARIGTSR